MVISPAETVTEVGEQLVKHPPQYFIRPRIWKWKEKLQMEHENTHISKYCTLHTQDSIGSYVYLPSIDENAAR
jgi:hypothetical protein